MNKKCLGCGKEYDSREQYCPDCYSKNREINQVGYVICNIGALILIACILFSGAIAVFMLGEVGYNILKIILIIGLILLIVGGTLRIDKIFNCTLVDKNNYNEKIKYNELIIRMLRYLILTVILGIIIYFIIKSMY